MPAPSEAHLLLLAGPQVQPLLTPDAVLASVREAFLLHSQGQGRLFPVVRERLATGGVFGIKSGDVEAQALLGFKAAGFWPQNRSRGGEPHQATVMLFDPASGRPTCLIDGNAITTARTGAAGRLGLELLARPDSTRLCVFGTGIQARVQLDLALDLLPAIVEVRYATSRGIPDPAFEAALAGRCAAIHVTDPDAAVAASDIVITATPGGGPLFSADAVRPGTHVNAVGTDTRGKRELPAGLLGRARVFVDDREQHRQIGEGQWADTHDVVEFGDLLAGTEPIARTETDLTVFDMTGLALQDLTVARMLYRRAIEEGHGTQIPWPW
ncbi:ornithine cyclodeaminase family protein [Methylobacterium platani]|uniref:Ornithine cyclodeaminase n=2 Tax=Methylobacterium platani TaxID=427683 RepID=A0A179SD06_9HYPH|nr:ornithine cyclodeaminase family protein [Methylobacterium platani]KMO11429.1 ornithine cyclodeaminase [Methylobacterium platani JCM 14648]OAS24727.1 ornithine cyclodeaminase [Methylobacterium platani]